MRRCRVVQPLPCPRHYHRYESNCHLLTSLSTVRFSTNATSDHNNYKSTNKNEPTTASTQDKTPTTTQQGSNNATSKTLSKSPSSSFLSLTNKNSNSAAATTTTTTTTTTAMLDTIQNVWNQYSGIDELGALKDRVTKAAHEFDLATIDVTEARRHLNELILQYERITNQHTSLVQRKDSWTKEDAAQFATVLSHEVELRTTLEQARSVVQQQEKNLSNCQLNYMNAMRKRYHEEQLWQDKWRMIGTFGTWSLIVLNSVVFLISQYLRDGQERQRLVAMKGFIQETISTTMKLPQTVPATTTTATTTETDTNQENTKSSSLPESEQSLKSSSSSLVSSAQVDSNHKAESEMTTTDRSTSTIPSNEKCTRTTTADHEPHEEQSIGEHESTVHDNTNNYNNNKPLSKWSYQNVPVGVWKKQLQPQELVQAFHIPSAMIGATSAAVFLSIIYVASSKR